LTTTNGIKKRVGIGNKDKVKELNQKVQSKGTKPEGAN
jgi:hypothetical protein